MIWSFKLFQFYFRAFFSICAEWLFMNTLYVCLCISSVPSSLTLNLTYLTLWCVVQCINCFGGKAKTKWPRNFSVWHHYVILALRASREAREEYSLHQSDTIRSFQLYQFQYVKTQSVQAVRGPFALKSWNTIHPYLWTVWRRGQIILF